MSGMGGGGSLGTATPPRTKACPRCGKRKRAGSFHKDASKRDRLSTYCKICCTEKRREWEKQNPEHMASRHRTANEVRRRKNQALREQFGITLDEYEALAEAQRHLCAICGNPETVSIHGGVVSRLAVDHDHETGRIRGLVCFRCNIIMGHLKDDASLARKIAKYLL